MGTIAGVRNSRPDSGCNRHTFIVGPSTTYDFSLDHQDHEAPPLPEKVTGRAQQLFSPTNAEPPLIPRKVISHSQSASTSISQNSSLNSSFENIGDHCDDEEVPPLLPKKKSKRKNILNRSININSQSPGGISSMKESSYSIRTEPSCLPQDVSDPKVSELSANDSINHECIPIVPADGSTHIGSNELLYSTQISNEIHNTSKTSRLSLFDKEVPFSLPRVLSTDESSNQSPFDSPQQIRTMHPSNESAPSNTSPVMGRMVPLISSSDISTSPPNLSPIVPRKAPAVPPPFRSPHASPSTIPQNPPILTQIPISPNISLHTLTAALQPYEPENIEQ